MLCWLGLVAQGGFFACPRYETRFALMLSRLFMDRPYVLNHAVYNSKRFASTCAFKLSSIRVRPNP